jgi:hypothetical protein
MVTACLTIPALSGEGSPQPISGQQNSTSDCWPILPKSDDLTFVASTNTTVSPSQSPPHSSQQGLTHFQGNYDGSAVVKNFFSVTPILTVFFPGNGNGSLVSRPEAQLTCLKAMDLTTASNSTQSQSDKGNAAGQLVGRGAAVLVGLVSVAFAVLMA